MREKMVQYANEVRKLFMGENSSGNLVNAIDITFSTRSLMRWAELTLRFQPLARQGIQPVSYALDRALAYRASRETRAMLHELVQRVFPQQEHVNFAREAESEEILKADEAIQYLRLRLCGLAAGSYGKVHLRKLSDNGVDTKDWIAEAQKDGMALRFGKTGSVNNKRFYELSICADNSSLSELESRAARKLREGYYLLVNESVF